MIPAIDMGLCTDCGSCLEICPEVFWRNVETEDMEVRDLNEYPEKCVQEAISFCPEDCIYWQSL